MTVGECRRTDRFVRHARPPPERLSRSAPKEETWVGRKRRGGSRRKEVAGRAWKDEFRDDLTLTFVAQKCAHSLGLLFPTLVPHSLSDSGPSPICYPWSFSRTTGRLDSSSICPFPLVFLGRMNGIHCGNWTSMKVCFDLFLWVPFTWERVRMGTCLGMSYERVHDKVLF